MKTLDSVIVFIILSKLTAKADVGSSLRDQALVRLTGQTGRLECGTIFSPLLMNAKTLAQEAHYLMSDYALWQGSASPSPRLTTQARCNAYMNRMAQLLSALSPDQTDATECLRAMWVESNYSPEVAGAAIAAYEQNLAKNKQLEAELLTASSPLIQTSL